MTGCLVESDLHLLGTEALADFDRRMPGIPENSCASYHAEARQLESQLITIYRATVLLVRREDDMDQVAVRWGEMVDICDRSLERLQKLVENHPACGADFYYDRVLELRGKCKRLQQMHC